MEKSAFQVLLKEYYANNSRSMPWREPELDGNYSLYKIGVSELMLQQTQVDRVIPKFQLFIAAFPTYESLARAPLSKVIKLWSGLGYNRRAVYLHEWAKQLVADGFPTSATQLSTSRGFGENTAAAVFVYTFNQPLVFVETNIRTVFLHHFFSEQEQVSDDAIRSKLQSVLDTDNPREFYWALMDYGTYLKKQRTAHLTRSAHYKKQPKFEGSNRQLRGKILKQFQSVDSLKLQEVLELFPDNRTLNCVEGLMSEGFLSKVGDDRLSLSN